MITHWAKIHGKNKMCWKENNKGQHLLKIHRLKNNSLDKVVLVENYRMMRSRKF